MSRITEDSINRVKDADILQVIGSYPDVKILRGNKMCCPFHGEKTPSLSINVTKQIFKCFGCGVGGNAISFVELKDRVEFLDAVKKIAHICGIRLDYEEETEKQKKERSDKHTLQTAMNFAVVLYQKNLTPALSINGEGDVGRANPGLRYLREVRGYDDETIEYWGLGWAPSEWRVLAGHLKGLNLTEAGEKVSLIKRKEGGEPYDIYRGRVIFPINDTNGRPISLGGRIVPGLNYGDQQPAKYINGAESPLYNKSRVLYGLDKATRGIKEFGFGILTEGYTDVISQHRAGNVNAVGSCGTALTPEHVQLMKRYSDEWWLMRDGDMAGIKAMLRDIPMLVAAGMKTKVLPMPLGEDPDWFASNYKSYHGHDAYEYVLSELSDGILWFADKKLNLAGLDVYKRSEAMRDIIVLLSKMPDEFVRAAYAEKIAFRTKEKKADIFKKLSEVLKAQAKVEDDEDEDAIPLPDWADEDEVMKWGFVERRDPKHCGYYFLGGSRSLTQQTNFVLKPLYHIYSQTDNRRLFEVYNGRDTMMVEIPSKSVLSQDLFCALLYNEGVFLPEGTYSKVHHMKLLKKISNELPMAYELTALGWQPAEVFFAFSNKVFKPGAGDAPYPPKGETIDGKNEEDGAPFGSAQGDTTKTMVGGKLEDYNEYGIVKVGDRHFYSPSKSKLNDYVRSDDNMYENDMYLFYKEASICFEEWCRVIVDTYDQHGWMMIAYVIGTAFRDIIIGVTPLPHLYPYGMVNSGKSQIGESIGNFFFSGKDSSGTLYKPFNLNQGTVYAFFNRMGRFINCPNILNEFDDNSINEEFFRAIKAAYDGEGREKGLKDKNKSTVQKIRCSLVIMGQFLGTKDENSVLTRSIPLATKAVPQSERTEKQLQAFDRLKALEHEGLSGLLVELLNKRPAFKKEFGETFSANMKVMTNALRDEEIQPQPRILRNYSCMLTIVQIAAKSWKLPFTVDEFYEYAKQSVKVMTNLVSSTSGVSEFWSTVEFLLDRGLIKERHEFIVEDGATSVTITVDKDKREDRNFTPPKNLLFIRLSGVHKLYQEQNRKAGGKNPLNEQTLLLYMREQPYYVGWVKAKKFKNGTNSCFVFDYDKLNINLKKHDDSEQVVVTVMGEIVSDIMNTPMKGKYKFMVRETGEVKRPDGTTKTNQLVYNCFSNEPSITVNAAKGNHIQMKGHLDIQIAYEKEQRYLDVIDFEVVAAGEMFTRDFGVETPVAEVQGEMPF